MLDQKIKLICEDVDATHPPILFITNSEWLNKHLNRERRWFGGTEQEFIPGFRYGIAKARPYKGTRHNPKPFHFYNIIAHLRANYTTIIAQDGYEADDLMCQYQTEYNELGKTTVICSRDKDLRICPGWHFSWECGKQKAIGPFFTDRLGSLDVKDNGDTIGYGMKFFYYQMLVGDTADNIPGLPKVGDAGAVKLLKDLTTEWEMFEAVRSMYLEKMGDSAKEYFREQADLLWMVQRHGEKYSPPKKGT